MNFKDISKDIDKLFHTSMCEIIKNTIKESLQDEDRVVKFNNRTYPKFGQAVIMVGGSGSGKSFCIESGIIPMDAKVFDTDAFKKKYVKLQANPKSSVAQTDSHQYDLSNDEDISALHWKVKDKGWDWKTQDAFMYDDSKSPDRLPNVIFDITGKDEGKLIDIAQTCREVGYEVTLVWVIVNRSRALWNNLDRDRNVKQDVFHSIHNQVNIVIPNFIKSKAGMYIDNVWLVYNSSETLGQKTDQEKKNTAVSLEKQGNGFVMSKEDEEQLMRMLGNNEPNPNNPQKYQSYDEIKSDTNFKKYGHKYNGQHTYKK